MKKTFTETKKKRYYIAYGSNLSIGQMAYRCPEARIEGTAVLGGWQLLFKGCATIKPKPGKNTPVLIWSISENDERSLDRYEGFPHLYYKKELPVMMFPTDEAGNPLDKDPQEVTAMVYIMDAQRRDLAAPSARYYGILEDGYRDFHFPMHILRQALTDSIGSRAAKAWMEQKPQFAAGWTH